MGGQSVQGSKVSTVWVSQPSVGLCLDSLQARTSCFIFTLAYSWFCDSGAIFRVIVH